MSRSTSSSSSHGGSSTSPPSDAFEELAAIFMTPGDDERLVGSSRGQAVTSDGASGSDAGRLAPAIRELLVVGHLPVRGSLWLTPYADALAREVGPVALVRLDGGDVTLEVMRGEGHWRSDIAGCPLKEAIKRIAPSIRAWVVRPDANGDVLTPELISEFDRLMLLSSADEAASVAAYQTFKRLNYDAERAGIDLPALKLTVVGSQPEIATWMVRRLQSTTASQLGLSVELDRVLPRIDSDMQSSVYLRFTDEDIASPTDVLAMIGQARPDARSRTGVSSGERDAPASEHSPTPGPGNSQQPLREAFANGRHVNEEAHLTSTVDSPANEMADGEPRVPRGDDEPLEWNPIVRPSEPGARIRIAPKPARDRAAERNQQAGSPKPDAEPRNDGDGQATFARHVPGLTALDIRSPRSDHVQLAVDATGRLHLLAEDERLRELQIVESWAKCHRELLAMALSHHAFDPDAEIILHLFTNEPARVADLHETGVKLHVLAPVNVEGCTGWYAAALNR